MWIYLLFSTIMTLIYYGILGYGYYKHKDIFWQRDITILLAVGIVMYVIELALYFSNNYGFFMLGLALEVFYLVLGGILVKQRLFSD